MIMEINVDKKEKTGSGLVKKYFDYIVIFVFYFPPHLFMGFDCWDDILYTSYLEDYHYNIFSFVVRQYQCWTSRIFIEAANILFGWLPPILWMVVDTLMIFLLYYSLTGIIKLWVKELDEEWKYRSCFLLLFLSFPYALMGTAGWLTTTINWTWMLALLVYSMKKLLYSITGNGKSGNIFMNILYCLAFLYATNFDVSTLLMLCLLLLIGIACYKSDLFKFSLEYREGLIITIVNLFLFIMCPGNRVRMERDAVFHDTADMLSLSVWGKLRMGINSTFYHYMSIPNVVLFTACVVIIIAVFRKRNDLFARIAACIPVGIVILWTAYIFVAYTVKNRTLTYVYPDASFTVSPKAEQYLALISALVLVASFIYLLRLIIDETNVYLFLTAVFLVWGLLPEVVLGFTTTISASILRVVSFFYFALILTSAVIIGRVQLLKTQIIWRGMILLGAVGTIMNYAQMIRHIMVYG